VAIGIRRRKLRISYISATDLSQFFPFGHIMPGATPPFSSKSLPLILWRLGTLLKCKGVTKDILQRFSLLGIVKHSLAIDKEYDLRAREVEQK
jgi:hypothetical protein